MARFLNPSDVAPPASRYSHGVLHGPGRRLVVSGQVGLAADGSRPEGLEAQMVQAWENLLAVVRAADMEPRHLVKATVFVTVPGSVATYRAVRDRMLGDHAPAVTYLEVGGLARPDFLVEIEGEAVAEGA